MEYSCYYYHSNDRTKITVFVKKDDLIEVRFLNYYTYEDEYDDDDNNDDNFSREFNMIVTFEQLKELKSLYNYYKLSLLLTENINSVKYVKNINSDHIDGWAIMSIKNIGKDYISQKIITQLVIYSKIYQPNLLSMT